MPEDVGGQPFPDGQEPEDDHGTADEEFAAVVLDEDFVRAAGIHEPSAAERMLAAAQSHAESEVPRPYDDGYVYGPPHDDDLHYDPDADDTTHGYGFGYGRRHRRGYDPGTYGDDDGDGYGDGDGPYDAAAGPRPYRGHVRWQRPVAWVLAVVMGVGMVALAFAAVYRGAAGERDEPAPPPPSRGVGLPVEDRVEDRVGEAGPGS
ncbi:hypothetical protein RM572_01840 [Streptomyces sp. DSM 42041]|uniref:Uncharacterized protein n=1 Tax=Streptomyces hazeniae TaxID=3075538 RepID=A0ABU2NL79_9ACTN|nr:hypothetical protein [Streptomyces sp. DSM 42041]MDT0377515.1 hypothetical protein [Streptomyces sp. DSM 42041]